MGEEFTHYLPYIKDDDFFGLQNYTRSLIGPDGICPVPEGAEITQMEYEFYPQALEHVIRRVHEEYTKAGKKNMPIMVTENGIAEGLHLLMRQQREWKHVLRIIYR